MAEYGGRLSERPSLSVGSEASSHPDLAAERNWWSEAMVATIQQMMAEQTRQLQASFKEEAREQRAMTQQLVAEHTQQLRGCVEQLEGCLSARGAAEERRGHEGEQDRYEGEASLRDMVQQFGATPSRLEEHLHPRGVITTDKLDLDHIPGLDLAGGALAPSQDDHDPDRIPDAPEDCTKDEHENLEPKTPALPRHLDRREGFSGWCRTQCNKKIFGLCVVCVIAANGIFVGCEANATMTSSDLSLPDGVQWQVARMGFAFAFLVELAIRWVADGSEFLRPRNEEFWWNFFDTLLILATVVEEVLYWFSIDAVACGVLRLTRLLRVTHITRTFKIVRKLKELSVMVHGLVSCARPLFWALVLIFGLTYMMGILVCGLIAEYLHSGQHVHLDANSMSYITANFSDLWGSMYSLFEALTGGRDWGDIAGPFRQVSWALGVCLVLYIFIGVFCILNLLTAVFLDAAQRVDTADHVYAKKDWVKEIRTFIRRAIEGLPPAGLAQTSAVTRNGSETKLLTKKGFFWLLEKAENQAYLKENGLDLFLMNRKRLGELFEIMDADGSETIEVDEFVSALYDLKGAASSMDLQLALHRIRSLQKQTEVIFRRAPRSSVSSVTSGLPLA